MRGVGGVTVVVGMGAVEVVVEEGGGGATAESELVVVAALVEEGENNDLILARMGAIDYCLLWVGIFFFTGRARILGASVESVTVRREGDEEDTKQGCR